MVLRTIHIFLVDHSYFTTLRFDREVTSGVGTGATQAGRRAVAQRGDGWFAVDA